VTGSACYETGCTSWPERFRVVEEFLRARVARSERCELPRRDVAAAWRLLTESRGTGSVSALTRDTAMSSRQLSTLFERELGIAPKTLAALMRFDHVLVALGTEIRAGRRPQLAEIAAASGFADHSHLVREFRRFTDASPSEFLGEEFRNIQAGGHQPTAQ
jgi:AraC-like DNA-binding protein